ncbi:hypothetical protein MJO28_009008 [Puccinia striiformis f. sp. tritici]|uniref:Uncharacterized protein n=1 Tax=Puccinia striiformis f. sp. tritici TaxID=168172 RepID=A0ACC0EEC4_9BASI|nr:hypothetical protein MJO28_009008 [Puccinia striiformis f. sp. tritici]
MYLLMLVIVMRLVSSQKMKRTMLPNCPVQDILVADKVIQSHAVTKIKDGVLSKKQGSHLTTSDFSLVMQAILLQAHQEEVKFSVVLVDPHPAYKAKNPLNFLSTVVSSLSSLNMRPSDRRKTQQNLTNCLHLTIKYATNFIPPSIQVPMHLTNLAVIQCYKSGRHYNGDH